MMLIKNATTASGVQIDLLIEAETIAAIGPVGSITAPDAVFDASGLRIFSGFVDLHTHLRQPGFEASETVLTGSSSAAAGGYTAVLAMANTLPVTDNPMVAKMVRELGEKAGLVQVQPVGAVTLGLEGKTLADIAGMNRDAGVRVFSDDGNCVSDPDLMRAALEAVAKFDGVIAQHAQDPEQTLGAQMNAGALATELGLQGWPVSAEAEIIARDIELAAATGGRLHICHLTSEAAVGAVRAGKKRGVDITAEVAPHHLMLTEELVRSYDPVYKVNPPLRRDSDVNALRAALIDGTIDALGTDHAPHSSEKKDCEWQHAAFGMVGLEHAASVLQQVLIESGESDWQRFEAVIASAPARIAGLANQGSLAVGATANVTLYDPAARRVIRPETASLSTNNPFAGRELPGAVVAVWYRGRQTVAMGQVLTNNARKAAK
jgi:dihydroorotase